MTDETTGDRVRRLPLATYRLQLTPGFGFAEAAAVAPYLARLGVSHAYLSPVLQAAPGSTHGYDVVDHSRASDELGGEDGFRAMVAAFDAEGLGVVLDVVPNHMAAALPQNRWWWDVLENGPSSVWASFFDIDWDPPDSALRNRVLLPVLGSRYGRVLVAGEVQVRYDGRSFTVVYFDQVYPLAPRSLDRVLNDAARTVGSPELEFLAGALGALPPAWATDRDSVRRRHRDKVVLLDRVAELYATDDGIAAAIDGAVSSVNKDPALLDALLERQNFRLAYWRTADEQLDYRRFFDIDTLVALRVEDAEVFAETHAHVLDWVREGLVDGLRIDHIDGLSAPQRYLERLDEQTGGAWIVVEKILEPGEALPDSWPVAGTTGYDFLNVVAKLFVDPAGEEPLTSAFAEVSGGRAEPADVVLAGKTQICDSSLAADLNRVVERLLRLTEQAPALRDVTRSEIHRAVRGLLVAFPVYRTYGGGLPARLEDIAVLDRAAASANASDPDLDEDLLAFVVDLLAGRGPVEPGRLDTARRFEQLSGPVMAKGVEDTAFYRYHRLLVANEVGSSLESWAISPAQWHARWDRVEGRLDASLLATTTHDTKRSEDVRARLALLSEIPDRWVAAVGKWRQSTDRHRTQVDTQRIWPDRATEYLMYQTFFGAWPLSAERALEYARKATREAKVHTSWTDADPVYEGALERWIRSTLADERFIVDLEEFVGALLEPGRVVSLAQTLCKLTAPGIPDLYQGTELWDLSLVDPDNRRPVDYATREALLRRLQSGELGPADALAGGDSGLAKLLVTARGLDLRRRRPACFGPGAGYQGYQASGPAADHLVVYGRAPQGGGVEAVTVVPRLVLGLTTRPSGWAGTEVVVPPGRWHDVLGDVVHESRGEPVAAGALLRAFPVALLELER
ncbi:MAG: malto-oligosyltrehalose synthase [Acidimicrobiales bacterium]